MATPPNAPPGKRSVPGIPSKQIWDARSFQTPPLSGFAFPWHWLKSLPNLVTLLVSTGLVLLALRFLNII